MTATPEQLLAAARRLLESAGTVGAHVADVPDALPADRDGRVHPYAVLWPSPGASRPHAALSGPTGLTWTCTVTVAAGDVDWCLQAVTVVRGVMADAELVPGVVLTEDTEALQSVRRDTDTTPARWYVPLTFYALAPHSTPTLAPPALRGA